VRVDEYRQASGAFEIDNFPMLTKGQRGRTTEWTESMHREKITTMGV